MLVLVVEDNDQVRRVVVKILQRAGYEVTAARTAEEALALCRDGTTPQILVADIVLAGLSGPDLARKLRAFVPSLRTLFISGYDPDYLYEREDLEEGIRIVAKPFRGKELVRAVRDLHD